MDKSTAGNGPGAVQMRVQALRRYPVKSMHGAKICELAMTRCGSAGDGSSPCAT